MNCNPTIPVQNVKGRTVYLGVFSTFNARSVTFDFSAWAEALGDGTFAVSMLRPGEYIPYQVAGLAIDGTMATWTFDATDTAIAGYGRAYLSYITPNAMDMTVDFDVYIAQNSAPSGETPPDPLETWYQQMLEASARAQNAAQNAEASAEAAAESESTVEGYKVAAEIAAQNAAAALALADQCAAAAALAQHAAETAATEAANAKTAAEAAQASAIAAANAAEAYEMAADASAAAAQAAEQAALASQAAAAASAQAASDNAAASIAARDAAQRAQENAQAASSAAAATAQAAANSASAAQNSASAAAQSAEDSEAWAVGQRGGADVPATDETYHNNAKYWAEQAEQAASGGVSSFNGRSGSVVPQPGDYTAQMVGADPSGAADAVKPKSGAGAPTSSTVADFLGQQYVDTTDEVVYSCVKIEGNVYTWKRGGSSPKLDRIYIDTPPTKTAYKAGETFDPTGMVVKADYAIDGIVVAEGAVVTGYSYPTGGLAADTTSVTITYAEGGVAKTATVAVTVTKTDVAIPTYSGSLTYNGSAQSPTFDSDPGALATKSGNISETNAGTYTTRFTLNDTDLYQWSDGSTGYKDVAWSIGRKAPTISASPASLTLDPSNLTADATITTDGDGALSVVSNDTSIATATISGNTVTAASVNETSGSTKLIVTLAAGVNYSGKTLEIPVEAKFVTIYGASWDGTSTTAWTRTDAAAGFTDPVPYVAGATSYGSPFDDLAPWKGMTRVTDSEAGEMVKIPKFWYKLTQIGVGMQIQIADGAVDGFSVCPACMDRGDGAGERDYVLIGRYHCASDYKSKTGVKPVANITRSAARSSISNLGSKVWMADWAVRFTIFLLYLVEFANWNSQAKIGRGCGDNSATGNMGYTDSMPYHTGTTQSSRYTFGLGTQYRNIEGLWDNVRDLIDGCYNSGSGLMIILKPAKSSDSAGGTSVGTPSNGYPSKFAVKDVSGTFPLFIPTEASGSDSTYSCDEWYFKASNPCVYVGGYYYNNTYLGLFCFGSDPTTGTDPYLGSRSMKLP